MSKTLQQKAAARLRKHVKKETTHTRPNFYRLVPNPNKPEYTKLRKATYTPLDLSKDITQYWLENMGNYHIALLTTNSPYYKKEA
jgi:hypothetical protein